MKLNYIKVSIMKNLIRYNLENQITQKENNEVFMNITVKKQDLQKLAQFIYLGNTVINGYKKNDEINVEYAQFAQDIYKQIMEFFPEKKSKYIFKNLPNERSTEAKIEFTIPFKIIILTFKTLYFAI